MYQVPRVVTLPGVPPVLLRMSRMYQVLRAVTPPAFPPFCSAGAEKAECIQVEGQEEEIKAPQSTPT